MSGHVTARAALAAIVLSAVAGCSVAAAAPVAEPTPGSTAPIGVVAGDPSPVPLVRATPTPTPQPTPEPEPVESKPEPKPTQTQQAKPEPKPKPTTPPPPPKPAPTSDVVTVAPTSYVGGQADIDRGLLVTWTAKTPTCILAGHDTMGWHWLDDIPTGTVVEVTTGPCTGRYQVYDHKWQEIKGGDFPEWIRADDLDLVLQTCTGAAGSGFSLARRIG